MVLTKTHGKESVILNPKNQTYGSMKTIHGRTCLDDYLTKKMGIFPLLYIYIWNYSTNFFLMDFLRFFGFFCWIFDIFFLYF